MAIQTVSIDDKYEQSHGRVLLSGSQALARLPMIQKEWDRAAGLDTAGYISGYPGSPLGDFDAALLQAREQLSRHDVVFQPGLNEDLAATAAWGTQQLENFPGAQRYDGVFALWYAKGPGVDRSGDAIKHANFAGVHPRGGVLAVYGDDHSAKSSSIAHQCDQAFAGFFVPILYPASVHEYLEYGLKGWALSRYSGLWVAFKGINETLAQTATVNLNLDPSLVTIPEGGIFPPEGVHFLPRSPDPVRNDRLIKRFKLPLAHHFARANGLDRSIIAKGDRPRLGIVTAGKSFIDTLQALRLLGIDESRAQALGISLYKVGMIWPLEPRNLTEFAEGQEELLVVEEKAPVVENQIRALLYNLDPGARPRVLGREDADGRKLLPATGELRPSRVMPVLAQWLARHAPGLDRRGSVPAFVATPVLANDADGVRRVPTFCAGCPHNLSTLVPAGSEASGGIGCHGMSGWMDRRNSFAQVPMGSEGIDWVGQSFFSRATHRFQNMGDGTYSHSGYLAIRQAVAAGANVTYKILYNDAVAMTGGQPVDRRLSVPEIARQLEAEGVARIAVLAEDALRWRGRAGEFPPRTLLRARDELDAVQRELRAIPGVTALIYDQVCATEQRRRIKRGLAVARTRHAFIHPDVCENCGDCTALSSCVAIRPLATPLGRKRRIDPSVCNDDYACLDANCPAMVTVEGGALRRKAGVAAQDERLARAIADLPDPPAWRWTARSSSGMKLPLTCARWGRSTAC